MGNKIFCCNYKTEESFSKKLMKICSEIEDKNVVKYVLYYDIETKKTEKKKHVDI